MELTKVLAKLNLQETIDYIIVGDSFEMVEQFRIVDQIISHEAVDEVLDAEGSVVSEAVEAYSETIQVQESFFSPRPTQEQLEAANVEVVLDESDIVLLISAYLEGKESLKDPKNDSINIVDNRIFGWSFANITKPTNAELVAFVSNVKSKQSEKILLTQIADLEASVTPRKIREAILSGDKTFIANVDSAISSVRHKLEKPKQEKLKELKDEA